jgi:hypothetical protein
VVHAAEGDWLIVDSCIDSDARVPVALEYLQKLGVDVATQVRLVVASHWHDDHIRGLAQTLEAAESADFSCSIALRSEEFAVLTELMKDSAFISKTGVAEFGRMFDVLSERRSHLWAVGDKRLWTRSGTECSVWALSPSNMAVTLSLRGFATLLPTSPGDPKGRVISLSPNHAAVVLLIEIGDVRVLLGADLEETGDDETGWTAILSSSGRPTGVAEVFKVPHHGSPDADQPRVWEEMLTSSPIAVLTPYTRGRTPRPTEDDKARICARTATAYLTAPARAPRSPRRDRAVERTVKEVVRTIRQVQPPVGHVRLRYDLQGQPAAWEVECFGAAASIC